MPSLILFRGSRIWGWLQSWIFIGRSDAEAPILRPPDVKNWLIGKDPDAEKDLGQEKKGMTENQMVGWHPWLEGHEFEPAPGVGDGQGSLACCSPWGHKKSWTRLSDWAELRVWKTLCCMNKILLKTQTSLNINLKISCDCYKKCVWWGPTTNFPKW